MPFFPRLFARRRRYDDISLSIEEHVAERADEFEAEGLTRDEAERRARREFGNVTLMTERSREAWQWPFVESVLADLKLTFRRLGKAPGFAATVLLTLAFGIGATTAVFNVFDSVLLKPLPYPHADRLAALWLSAPGAGGLANFSSGLELSASMYFTFAEHNQSFQSLGIWTIGNANVTGLARPEEVRTAMVSEGVLETLAVPPALGRWFTHADQDPHGERAVILSYGYWQRQFGGDPSVIGRNLQVDGLPREIVGVMPRGFRIVDRDFDLLAPFAFDRAGLKLAGFGFDGIGRLKPGVTLEQADADIARLLPVWMDSWSNGPGSNPHYYEVWRITPHFRSLKQQVIGGVSGVLWLVMATVGLVLLIACINVANLMLVRAEARHQELSIRAALGAGRARIARELLVESLVLGLLGGLLGLGVAAAGLRLLAAVGPENLPRLSEIGLDPRTFAFTLLLSIVAGIFFGAIPALKYARGGATAALSASRTASANRTRGRARSVLVIAQVAMALVLLVSALLMIRSFAALRDVQPGFTDAAHIETVRISVPVSLVPDPRAVVRLQNDIIDNLSRVPGVEAAGFASALPMEGFDPNWDQIRVEGKNYEGGDPPLRLFNYVSPGYFGAMGTRLVAGRDFTWTDIYDLRPRVIVSDNFARENWGSAAAAVGKRVRQFTDRPWQEVIGVVEDVRQHGVDEKAPGIVYWPAYLEDPYHLQPVDDITRSMRFAIRSRRAGEAAFLSQLQQAVWAANANLPLASVETMQQLYGDSLARTSFTLVMLAIAGSMALALGIIGIYGVIAYSVAQRTREIGIRLALGAQKSELKWMFVRSALSLTLAGIAIGLACSAGVTHWMRSLLFGISPLDPVTYALVPLVLLAAAAVASYVPSRRATTVDPVDALRAE